MVEFAGLVEASGGTNLQKLKYQCRKGPNPPQEMFVARYSETPGESNSRHGA